MKKIFYICFFFSIMSPLSTEILVFKNCKSNDYNYEKNEYLLDLEKGIMTRKFIYDEESYKKLRLNDITIKRKNTTNKGIIKEGNLIVSEISGYPAFYTQMIFDEKNSSIKIKTVLNNTIGESLVSKCENIIKYKK